MLDAKKKFTERARLLHSPLPPTHRCENTDIHTHTCVQTCQTCTQMAVSDTGGKFTESCTYHSGCSFSQCQMKFVKVIEYVMLTFLYHMHINKKKILKWIILRQLKQFQHNFSSKKRAGVILFEGSLLSHLLVCHIYLLFSSKISEYVCQSFNKKNI